MRGSPRIEQQHALAEAAKIPRRPGAEDAGADDDRVPTALEVAT